MVIMVVVICVFKVIDFVVSLLPDLSGLPSWLSDFMAMVGYALNIIPSDVWIITIVNVGLWKFGLIAWSLVEWVYKKIPGVD